MATADHEKSLLNSARKKSVSCLVHLFLKDRTRIVRFSETSWQKVCDCANEWLNLEGDKKRVSSQHRQLWTVPFDPSAPYGYHHACYASFTNKYAINRARKRKGIIAKSLPVSSRTRGSVLAAKYPQVPTPMEELVSELQELQQEFEQTQHSDKHTVDRLEGRRTQMYQFVDEAVDLVKSRVIKRQNEKLSLLEKQMEKLKKQIASLREAKSSLHKALQQLEDISFLQGHTDLVKRFESSQFQYVRMTPFTLLGISQEEKNLDLLIKLNKNILKEMQKDLVMVELDRIVMRSFYGQTPSLDPNSAHPQIAISQDLKTATRTRTKHPYPEHPDRFDHYPQVLSSESFSSGRHYWEVDVSSSRSCRIGICLNSMRRKGRRGECNFGGNPKSWCLQKCNNEYSACHNYQGTSLSVPWDPERFGFFLDCEAGELRCFGDSWVLHVFKGNFMHPVKPSIGVCDVGSVQFCSF